MILSSKVKVFFSTAVVVYYAILFHSVNSEIVYGASQHYSNVTFHEILDCVPLLNIALVVDVTSSQTNKINSLISHLEHAFPKISEKYPNSKFSLSTSTDKPIPPLGFVTASWTDYCFAVHEPFTESYMTIVNKLKAVPSSGGHDFPENQLEALTIASIAPQLHWVTTPVEHKSGKPQVKIVMLATDSNYHVAGDAAGANLLVKPNAKPLKLGSDLTAADLVSSPNAGCTTYDYPALDFVGKTLKVEKILPIILTEPIYYTGSDGVLKAYPEMQLLAEMTANSAYADPFTGIKALYIDLLKKLQVSGAVLNINTSPQSFTESLLYSLENLISFDGLCLPDDSTTPGFSPSTTVVPSSTTSNEISSTTPVPSTTTAFIDSTTGFIDSTTAFIDSTTTAFIDSTTTAFIDSTTTAFIDSTTTAFIDSTTTALTASNTTLEPTETTLPLCKKLCETCECVPLKDEVQINVNISIG